MTPQELDQLLCEWGDKVSTAFKEVTGQRCPVLLVLRHDEFIHVSMNVAPDLAHALAQYAIDAMHGDLQQLTPRDSLQ